MDTPETGFGGGPQGERPLATSTRLRFLRLGGAEGTLWGLVARTACRRTSQMETIQVRKGTTERMKSKDKRDEILQVRVSSIQSHPENPSANDKHSHEEIRLRAYEIYLERGGLPGNQLDDWLQAERDLERLALPKANGFSIKGEAG